jgi:hypothetical protein
MEISGCPYLVPPVTSKDLGDTEGIEMADALSPLVHLFLGNGCVQNLGYQGRQIRLETFSCSIPFCDFEQVCQSVQGSVSCKMEKGTYRVYAVTLRGARLPARG